MATRQLWRQHVPRLSSITTTAPVRRSVPRPRFQSSESGHGSSNAGTQSSPFVSWSVPAVAVAVGVGAAYWLMNPPANRKLAKATPGAAAAGLAVEVPDLNKLGMSDKITYAAVPSSDEVTQRLNEHAFSFQQPGAPGISRYDGAQLGSNAICEDTFLHGSFSSPFGGVGGDEKWMAWAVFDGHCGWQFSDLLTRQLMPFVRKALGEVKPKGGDAAAQDEEAVHTALKSAFTNLDDSLVKPAATIVESDATLADKMSKLEAPNAGACALLTLYDPTSRKLRIASTGDCRAVFGRKTEDGKWECVQLTIDQTGANKDEVARLNAQFPDEREMCKQGRVWGMMPSRTFGDGMWKWPTSLKHTLRRHYNGMTLPHPGRYQEYKEGPYLTAEPVVTTMDVPDSQPSFLILATDGLWDTMKSQQAVDLVGRWVDWQAKGKPEASKPDFEPAKTLTWCEYDEKKATVQDENAAVHLVRNGLGGADEGMLKGALVSRYPNSRNIRDDITVQVVLFEPKTTGK